MDVATARMVLGVTETTNWIEVRATYRELIRRHHPDVAVDLADAGVRTLRTAQITEAFAAIVAERAERPEARPSAGATGGGSEPSRTPPPPDDLIGPSFRHPTIGLDDTRVVLLDASMSDAFVALHEAFSILGAVSYIDRLSLVLEAIVVPVPQQATSLLTWLDCAPDGLTQATICVESLGGHPAAALDPLVDRIAELLASPRPPVPST